MDNYEYLQSIKDELNQIEDRLKGLRDLVNTPTQRAINEAVERVFPLRDALQKIDGCLEAGNGF